MYFNFNYTVMVAETCNKSLINSSVRDKMHHVISYEESRDIPIKLILGHKRRSNHTFL